MGLCNGPKWISVNILSGINIYCIKRYLTDVEPQKRRINNYIVWVVKCAGLSNTKGGLTIRVALQICSTSFLRRALRICIIFHYHRRRRS